MSANTSSRSVMPCTSLHHSFVVLSFLPLLLCSECGFLPSGWSCENLTDGHRISYTCSSQLESEAIWLWASLRSNATIVVIKNCGQVSVDLDCCNHFNTMQQFHAENIKLLTIHVASTYDTETVPTSKFLRLTNVGSLHWTLDSDDDLPAQNCHFKPSSTLDNIYLDNVSIAADTAMLGPFASGGCKSLTLKNLKLNPAVTESYQASEYIAIVNCSLDLRDGLRLEAPKVVICSNNITSVERNGLTVTAKHFQFVENNVTDVKPDGFNIKSENVNISANYWHNLDPDGFSKISLKTTADGQNTFTFSSNNFSQIRKLRLRPGLIFKNIKNKNTRIIIAGNSEPCECNLPLTNSGNMSTDLHNSLQLVGAEGSFCLRLSECSFSYLSEKLSTTESNNCSSSGLRVAVGVLTFLLVTIVLIFLLTKLKSHNNYLFRYVYRHVQFDTGEDDLL